MTFTLHPKKGAGDITFGMTPEQVREKLDSSFSSFKRTPDAIYPCDYFSSLGAFVYYDKNKKVEAIELTEPAQVYLNKENISRLSHQQIEQIFVQIDPKLEVEEDSLLSFLLGVGVYSPNSTESPLAKPESIIVFQDGYYD